MKNLKLSDIYWGTWIFVFFLIPEVLAALNLIPMDTLSNTTWLDQKLYSWLANLVTGFLIGLIIHLRWKFGLFRTEGVIIPLVYILDFILK